ncbi:response regulator transcription factor [Streptomyces sp. MZ04]|uniref:response regulator transcription factor n=1 Tax=Streptomyces sp. MZ04 TaxID=2559236 RepID=UPI001432C7D7|nr:response regulator transcription factor [Streptomyces sp. MZ04]
MEAIRNLLSLATPPRILALASAEAEGSVLAAIGAGAAGFLRKDHTAGELAGAVRTVAAGGTVHAPKIMKTLIGKGTGVPGMPEKIAALTDSEREVLACIGNGRTNEQIAEELHLSQTAVKTYVSRLLARLGLDNRPQAAIVAHEAGMVTV